MARRPTTTSNFGASRRESHDATPFYERFVAPVLSDDETVSREPRDIDDIFVHSATSMDEIPDASVALVVTSPPYFAGKQYEQELGQGEIPATYIEYLRMLHDVFAQCVAKLEPGGRIAVNVANLGRKPYRSLAGDIVAILEQDLQLLLRGEVVWQKARGSAGSCAWGSFQKAGNPVLRDVTERVVVASKGRFDRALSIAKREREKLPWRSTLTREEFMEATTDVWELPAESARRVNHPAPFPVELPRRLIDLYTYEGDLVLDPFMGSGTTAVAAVLADRHFVGYDTDAAYRDRAMARVAAAREQRAHDVRTDVLLAHRRPDAASGTDDAFDALESVRAGLGARDVAVELLGRCGFRDVDPKRTYRGGVEYVVARDAHGDEWHFDVSGSFTTTVTGLKRTETLWRVLGQASVLARQVPDGRLVLLTTDVPVRSSAGAVALAQVQGAGVVDVVVLGDAAGRERLERYAREGVAALDAG